MHSVFYVLNTKTKKYYVNRIFMLHYTKKEFVF